MRRWLTGGSTPTSPSSAWAASAAPAAFFAARRGRRVIGLERFELGGHVRGASHDHSRIIRRSYHTEHYVRLTAAAYDAWREVEAASGERCVWITGGVDLFPPGAAIDASTYTSAMDAARCPVRDAGRHRGAPPLAGLLGGRRRPGALPGRDRAGVAGPGGAAPASAWPRPTGPTSAVVAWCASSGRAPEGVDLLVDGLDRPLRAAFGRPGRRRLDQRAARRAREPTLPLTVLQEQVSYYHVDDATPFGHGTLPGLDLDGRAELLRLPHLRARRGQDRPGLRRGRRSPPTTGATSRIPAILARTDAFGRACFGGRLGPVAHTATCLYTLTPDRDFVLDRVPGHPCVLVAQGAAHGFKFAAWFGRTLAALAAGGGRPTTSPPSPSTDRPCVSPLERRPGWCDASELDRRGSIRR